MAKREVMQALGDGKRLLLDGANGTEFKRRGITNSVNPDGSVNQGITTSSAKVAIDAPDELQEVHEDYLRAGADIVTTNTFNTSREKLFKRGIGHLADRSEELTGKAAEITVKARDRINPKAYVAGSISGPHGRQTSLDRKKLATEHAVMATTLTDAGVDIILLEYVRSVSMAELAVQAVAEVGLPVFLGIANATTKGTMEYADSTDQLVEALGEHGPDAILTMCSRPDGISATLPNLRNSFDRPIGGYSNLTRIQNRYPPQTYAQTARGWLDAGAQIIGGCCGSTPDHIAALRALIDESPGRM